MDGLGKDDVAALATALKAESLDNDAVQWLTTHTGGHALYLRTVPSEEFDFHPGRRSARRCPRRWRRPSAIT